MRAQVPGPQGSWAKIITWHISGQERGPQGRGSSLRRLTSQSASAWWEPATNAKQALQLVGTCIARTCGFKGQLGRAKSESGRVVDGMGTGGWLSLSATARHQSINAMLLRVSFP